MRFPKVRLVVSALLLAVWLGYLLFLVVGSRDPIVLSRPQLAEAELCVLATIDEAGQARATQILWPEHDSRDASALTLDLRTPIAEIKYYRGPGVYLLPLTRDDGAYVVTPIPNLPGNAPIGQRLIYPASPETSAQLRRIKRGED